MSNGCVWVLESVGYRPDEYAVEDCEVSRFCGLFRTAEDAMQHYTKEECDAALTWGQVNDSMWKGHSEDHRHCATALREELP